jgi:hypothetical protein
MVAPVSRFSGNGGSEQRRIGDWGGVVGAVGAYAGLVETGRDGTLTKIHFTGRLHAERDFQVHFRTVLRRGSVCGCAKTAGSCRELLQGEVSLFLFAFVNGVDPTNNAAERALRMECC